MNEFHGLLRQVERREPLRGRQDLNRRMRERGPTNAGVRGPTKSVNEFDSFPPSFWQPNWELKVVAEQVGRRVELMVATSKMPGRDAGARGATEGCMMRPIKRTVVINCARRRAVGKVILGPTKSIANSEGATKDKSSNCIQLFPSFPPAVHRTIQSLTSSKEILFSEHRKSSCPAIPASSFWSDARADRGTFH
jgi:hypothetical protein